MTQRSPSRWVLAALLAWAPAASALAQPPRAVVLSFAGPRASTARDAVVDALAPEVQLVTEEQAIDTASQLGVDISSVEGFARVVHELRITYVVAGEVRGRGRRAHTEIVVLDADGNELATRTGPGPSDRDGVGAAAIEAIREAQHPAEPEPDPVQENPPQHDPETPVTAPDPEPAQPAAAGWRRQQLLALAGVRLRNVGNYVTDTTGLIHYFAADVFPEIALSFTFHPWFEDRDEALRGVFLSTMGSFSAGISWLSTTGEPRGMTGLQWRLDAGYDYIIGDIFEIAGMLGVGIDGVQLDRPEDFPSTLYTYLRPAIAARLRAVPDFVIIEAGVGGRIGLDGGPLAATFGPSMFFGGFDLYLGLAGTVDPGFSWQARVGYIRDALSFSGGGGTNAMGVDGTHEAFEARFMIGWAI